jgi:hypothetical protein
MYDINLLVRHVDGDIGLFCVVVRQNSNVGQCPAKDVADDKDSSVLVVTRYIGLVFAERGLLAHRLAVPGESSFAILAGHVERSD